MESESGFGETSIFGEEDEAEWKAGLIEQPLRGSDHFRQAVMRTWARQRLWNVEESWDTRSVEMERQDCRPGGVAMLIALSDLLESLSPTVQTKGHLHYTYSNGKLGTTFSRLDLPQCSVHDSWVKAQDFSPAGKQSPNPTEKGFKEKSKSK